MLEGAVAGGPYSSALWQRHRSATPMRQHRLNIASLNRAPNRFKCSKVQRLQVFFPFARLQRHHETRLASPFRRGTRAQQLAIRSSGQTLVTEDDRNRLTGKDLLSLLQRAGGISLNREAVENAHHGLNMFRAVGNNQSIQWFQHFSSPLPASITDFDYGLINRT